MFNPQQRLRLVNRGANLGREREEYQIQASGSLGMMPWLHTG